MEEIPDFNIFMMCNKLNASALSDLPEGFYIRNCRKNELEIWKAMPFDDEKLAKEHYIFMTDYFNDVYASKGDLFFKKCLFVCNKNDIPIATCFVWKAYGLINTVHWFKVIKSYEGKGIGRALLSIIMQGLSKDEYPIYLHTQPASYKAIKLYSDFGFDLISSKELIGIRENQLEGSLPILKKYMPIEEFNKLRISEAPQSLIETLKPIKTNQF